MVWIGLASLGLAVGFLGTLIGAGGGFLLMPALVLLYPEEAPEALASISLAVVFLNALSGSIGYARQGLIDYRAGRLFMAAGIPGAIGGAFVTGLLPRAAFDLWLGATLVIIALVVLIAGGPRSLSRHDGAKSAPIRRGWQGALLSFGVGFVSSLLGIGGGIIHVPAMVHLLNFPVHVAAATSHFVLAGTSLAGTLVHVASGSFTHGFRRTAALGVGVIAGAQIGALMAKRTPSIWIMRGLAIALVCAGVRVIWVAVGAMPR